MKLLLSISCAVLGFSGAAQVSQKYPAGIEHVIVVGVDGLSPDGIRNAETPVLKKMISEGSVKWNVRTVLPSSSSPNWASMIMGAGVEQHGVTDNDWERTGHSLPAIVTDNDGYFPTIFGVVDGQRSNAEIGAVYHWEGFGRLFEKRAVDYDRHFETEDKSTADFVQYIRQKRPVFAFLHLDHVDHAGHHDGHGTPQYYASVSKADSLIGEVLNAVKKAGIERNTVVIITSDHGGVGYGHGGASTEEGEIAMILYGKAVKQNYEIPEQAATYDLAATIAFALRIEVPYVWIGRPLKSAFKGFKPPSNFWSGRSLIASPVIYPKRNLYEQAGGLYINEEPVVRMETVARNAVTYYTIDGTEPDSTAKVYESPIRLNRTAVVKAISIDNKNNRSNTGIAYFRLVDSTGKNGLNATLYKGEGWKYLPLFKDLQPTARWHSYEFYLPREKIYSYLGQDHNTFGVVFNGFIKIDTAGEYTFYCSSDDGSKLYVDGKLVVNNDGDHGVIERSGSIGLKSGYYPVKVEYYNGGGGFWLDAFYKGPGITKQLIPADRLFIEIPK